MSMSDDKRIKLENTDSPSMNEDGHEQRRNWKEWLKYICDYNSGNNTHHMLNMDVEDGELSGVVKMGNEVIEHSNGSKVGSQPIYNIWISHFPYKYPHI